MLSIYFNHKNIYYIILLITFIFCLVSTLKRRPSPSTSSLSSNSSCDRRGGSIQLTKFGMFIFYILISFTKIIIISHSPIVYLGSFPGKNKKERYLNVVWSLYNFLFIIIRFVFLFFFKYSFFFLLGTQSPDAVNKLLRLSDSSHQIKNRTPHRPFHLSTSSSLSNTSAPNSASPLLSNSSTTTGLSSLTESTHHHHHHRNNHVTKIRDTNKLTSESSSLNFKQPTSHTHVTRSQTRKLYMHIK